MAHRLSSKRIAVVGSRSYKSLSKVKEFITGVPLNSIIVSGGARGVDSEAIARARSRGLETEIHHPNWAMFGKLAGYRRNLLIIAEADQVVAFWNGKSRGTKHTIDICNKTGIPIRIIREDKDV